jgi:hypothetical protein
LKIDNERVLIFLIDVIHLDFMYSYDEDSIACCDRVLYCLRSIVIRLQNRLNRDRLDLNSNIFASKSSHVSHSLYDLLHDREKILV